MFLCGVALDRKYLCAELCREDLNRILRMRVKLKDVYSLLLRSWYDVSRSVLMKG